MWIVFMDGGKMKPQKFKTDQEAEHFMLAFLEDENLCPFPNRDQLRSQLNESYQNRTQMREGWGVFPFITARWVEF